MLIALRAKTIPSVRINCKIAIKGKNTRCQVIPIPPKIQNKMIIIQLIKSLLSH